MWRRRCCRGPHILLMSWILCTAALPWLLVAAAAQVTSGRSSTACYGELGCLSTGPPFTQYPERPVSLLPQDRAKINTRFYLYTCDNADAAQQLVSGEYTSISGSHFVARRSTVFLIHGFMSSGHSGWPIDMKAELLLTADDYNVIIVDWGGGAGLPYSQATANTRLVGAEIALLVNYLKEQFGVSTMNVHLIGHSLGAHVAGYAGAGVNSVYRITGLDPAEPYFENTDPVVRLDRTDAYFVDVIHTDASRFTTLSGFGMDQAIGHADFYPNGGKAQPGCSQDSVSIVEIDGIEKGELLYVSCNHGRAHQLFTESIRSPPHCVFESARCPSYERYLAGQCAGNERRPMGLHATRPCWSDHPADTPATYYTVTRGTPPYCLM